MQSKYVLQLTDRTRCPKCEQLAHWLGHVYNPHQPGFYICWNCKTVHQVGVGPVYEQLTFSPELLNENKTTH